MTKGELVAVVIAVISTIAAIVVPYAIYRLAKRDTRRAVKYDGDLKAVKHALSTLDRIVEAIHLSPRTRSELDDLELSSATRTLEDARKNLTKVQAHLSLVLAHVAGVRVDSYPEKKAFEFRGLVQEGKLDEERFQEVFRVVSGKVLRQHLSADELGKAVADTRLRLERYYK